MSPRRIVKKAKQRGLDIIGICDHNSAENVVSTKKVGEKEGLTVIGGIEVTSQEEAHILAFFWHLRYLHLGIVPAQIIA